MTEEQAPQMRVNEPQLARHLREGDHEPKVIAYLANHVLIAAHERKVTRSFFIDVINLHAHLHAQLTRFAKAGVTSFMLQSIDADHKFGPLDEAAEDCIEQIIKLRHQLADKLDLMQECPTHETIN